MFWSDRGTNGQTDGQANERDTEIIENMDTWPIISSRCGKYQFFTDYDA